MVQYMTCTAKPPFTVGIKAFSPSAKEVFRQLGIYVNEPEKVEAPVNVVEEVKEEPVSVEEVHTEEDASDKEDTDKTSIDVLSLKRNYKATLLDKGINYVEDLISYIESGKSLSELSISEAAVKSITEKLEQWQKEQKATK